MSRAAHPLLVIADNLTVTDPRFAAALSAHDSATVRGLAMDLAAAGVDMLDLNLGYRSKDAAGDAAWVVREVANATRLPLCLDTADVAAMRAGLETALELGLEPPLVNSFSLDRAKAEGMLSLATEFGAAVVGFCVRDTVPWTTEDRLEAAVALIALADDAGLPHSRLFVDPILLAFNSFQEDAGHVLEFLQALPELVQPPVRTLAALSNLSYGLRGASRTTVESTFLAMAASRGLDAVLLNARDVALRGALRTVQAVRMARVFAPADLDGQGP